MIIDGLRALSSNNDLLLQAIRFLAVAAFLMHFLSMLISKSTVRTIVKIRIDYIRIITAFSEAKVHRFRQGHDLGFESVGITIEDIGYS